MNSNIVLIVAIIILLFFTIRGCVRGFMKTLLSMVSLVVGIILVSLLNPILNEVIEKNTSLSETVSTAIQSQLSDSLYDYVAQTSDAMIPAEEAEEFVNNLVLPDAAKDAIMEKLTESSAPSVNVDGFLKTISDSLSHLVVSAVSFVLLLVIVLLLLKLISFILDIIGKLPVIHGVNQFLGILLGFLQGLVTLWILCILVSAFSGSSKICADIMVAVQTNIVLKGIYSYNPLLPLLITFFN